MACHPSGEPSLPFKANADCHHRVPKPRFRATNWAAYDAALRGRGSLTVWFTEAAIVAWKAEPRTTRGGQRRYSELAINTALTLRAVFRLALRQTEGLIGSIIALLRLDLAVPDHSTLGRRAETLEVARGSSRHTSHTPARGQYGAAAMWPGRVAGREAREQDAPIVAQVAHRCGRRHWADSRGRIDRARHR